MLGFFMSPETFGERSVRREVSLASQQRLYERSHLLDLLRVGDTVSQ